jgi:PhnB protein
MATLNPYLTFNGNCKEAMGIYKEIFARELSLMTAGESPVPTKCLPVITTPFCIHPLKTENFEIMATDMVRVNY